MIQEGLPGPLVAIVGPTASGKSSLAEKIATELQSSVVSVDAMHQWLKENPTAFIAAMAE